MDNEYLKRIYGLLESGATLGTGAVSGLVGMPYGLYKGVTSGAYGTPQAPRIAAREAQQFMERNTYQPRTAEGQANLQQLAGLLEASKLPPVIPEASLLAAIPKQAYAAQAERAGMAAEKAIAPAVTRTMERGGLPAQLLGDLSQGSIRPMDVWHGSTNKELTQLNPKKSFGNLGVSWVSPEEEFAKRYAGKEGKVYKLDLNEGKNFDFANQEHLNLLKEKTKSVDIYDPIRGAMTLDKKVPDSGSYYSAEDPQLFNAIKKMGFDTVSVYEDGVRNIGVFNPKKNIKFIDESSDAGLLGQPKAAEPTDLLSYRGSHTAPGPDFGAPLHDLTGGGQMYPADVYSTKAAQYYGTGYPKADKEAFALANKVRGNPDAEVMMYRAVPKDASIESINTGDWVTLSKDYAKNHGEAVLDNDYKIISKKVKAKDLWTNADSIHEFGYWPE